jgi:hypothetical protein
MRNIMLMITYCYILTSCATVPDLILCTNDSPTTAHCAHSLRGESFAVDNSGHNYREHGVNWNLDQLRGYSLMITPMDWKVAKQYFLAQCHAHPEQCNPTSIEDIFKRIEQ